LRRSRRLSGAVLVEPIRANQGESRRSKGNVANVANISAPHPNAAHSRRLSSRTQAKNDLSNRDAKKPASGVGAKRRFRATSISNEKDLDPPIPNRKRGRSSTNTESLGDGGYSPAAKKQDTRKSRGRRSSVPDVLMEDSFESDDVTCLLPDVNNASTTSGVDMLFTSEDDHCLTRRVCGPFDASKFTTGISLFDRDSQSDAEQVSDYVTDIFQRLFDAEVS
jgi:hypothetical protein